MQPIAWANQLNQIWRSYCATVERDPYPIQVHEIIDGYINVRFPEEKIVVFEQNFNSVEGVLMPLEKGGWGIFYSPLIKNKGRKNFTIAHELGHYLNHRSIKSEFYCGSKELHDLGNNKNSVEIEREANEFAAYLLMPVDQLRFKLGYKKIISVENLQECSDLFETSFAATAYQWLKCTNLHAIYYEVHPEGFVTTWRRSRAADKAYIYLRFGMEIPEGCMARRCLNDLTDYCCGQMFEKGIWHADYNVYESCFYNRWYNKIQGVLIYL